MIFRGTGLNFGNDPFATVGEGGGIRMKGKGRGVKRGRRRWMKGLRDRMKKSSRRQRKERERGFEEISSALTAAGAGKQRPINRRALSQSRKTAKLHLPF